MIYVKSSIKCIFADTDHEVLWADVKPRRLPRGFSNIIVGMVYQPPDANDVTKRDYLLSCLESLEARYPNCAFVLAGDFNRSLLPLIHSVVKAFHLKPVVDFPTRGDRTLDQIFTNISEYFSTTSQSTPFGLSYHQTVSYEVWPPS